MLRSGRHDGRRDRSGMPGSGVLIALALCCGLATAGLAQTPPEDEAATIGGEARASRAPVDEAEHVRQELAALVQSLAASNRALSQRLEALESRRGELDATLKSTLGELPGLLDDLAVRDQELSAKLRQAEDRERLLSQRIQELETVLEGAASARRELEARFDAARVELEERFAAALVERAVAAAPPAEAEAAAAAAEAEAAAVIARTTERVNLRSGPGTEHGALTQLPRGARAEVLARGGTWHKVRSGDGHEGWVHGGYLEVEGEEVANLRHALAQTRSELEASRLEIRRLRQQRLVRGWTIDGVNLRLGPGTAHSRRRVLPSETVVEVLAEEDAWIEVRAGAETGWVAADYLIVEEARRGQVAEAASVFAEPDADSPTAGALAADTEVEVVARKRGWLQVRAGDIAGWVAAGDVALADR